MRFEIRTLNVKHQLQSNQIYLKLIRLLKCLQLYVEVLLLPQLMPSRHYKKRYIFISLTCLFYFRPSVLSTNVWERKFSSGSAKKSPSSFSPIQILSDGFVFVSYVLSGSIISSSRLFLSTASSLRLMKNKFMLSKSLPIAFNACAFVNVED